MFEEEYVSRIQNEIREYREELEYYRRNPEEDYQVDHYFKKSELIEMKIDELQDSLDNL